MQLRRLLRYCCVAVLATTLARGGEPTLATDPAIATVDPPVTTDAGLQTLRRGGNAVDAEGNWAAITATVNTAFGSNVIVPDTGVILNNQMDDSSIAPGKRPLSSMSPTIVLKGGKPILTLGAAGGPTIITQVAQTIIYHLDLGLALPAAVAAPRIHHQWMPDRLRIEESLDDAITTQLKSRGHKIKRTKTIGVLQAMGISRDGKTLIGVRDSRARGNAPAQSLQVSSKASALSPRLRGYAQLRD